VREDGRLVSGEELREKVCEREEWEKLLKKARNLRNVNRIVWVCSLNISAGSK
jgi:hypothetical protein